MDHYFCTHHANHYERICPKFINYFTSVLTPPEPPKREKRSNKDDDEKYHEDEEEEEEGDESSSHLNLRWDEE